MGEENEGKKVLNLFLFMLKGVVQPCDPWLEWPLHGTDRNVEVRSFLCGETFLQAENLNPGFCR